MQAAFETAGEQVGLHCEVPWVADLLVESCAGQQSGAGHDVPTVTLVVERDRRGFPEGGLSPLARRAMHADGVVLIRGVHRTGFDLLVDARGDTLELTARWRPVGSERTAAALLRSRFHLLVRAGLLQHPVLWWAGRRGRAPLHVSAVVRDGRGVLVCGPSGSGKSTLVATEAQHGADIVSDNLCASDGSTVWGVLEPMRLDAGSCAGRRMSHGRREQPIPQWVSRCTADRVVVLRRGVETCVGEPMTSEDVARELVTATYAAGELSRFWVLAALLACGTARGPAHPAVAGVAGALAHRVPAHRLVLGSVGERLPQEVLVEEARCR